MECYIALVSQHQPDGLGITPFIHKEQDWALDLGAQPVSKVQPCEWKQYGYWARPFLNNVECPNSREFCSFLDCVSIRLTSFEIKLSTARQASTTILSKI